MTVREAIDKIQTGLRKHDIENATAESEWLVSHILGVNRAGLFLDPGRSVNMQQEEWLLDALDRRLKREPLQYILGDVEFCGCTIKVAPGVLIPRPETEWLVETVSSENWGSGIRSVLDVGTGSGAIAVTLASRWPDAHITAADISPDALRLAHRNATANDVDARVRLIRADLHTLPFQPRTFDLIISNPPYICSDLIPVLSPEVREYEPLLALDGGANGLTCYKALATEGKRLLTDKGRIVMELPGHAPDEIVRLFRILGYRALQVTPDWAGKPRLLSARNWT